MSSPLPKLSYVLLSHNREKYIRTAIESAFAQDYEGELEYIFSDDCSTDRTFEIIKECVAEYKGTRRVVVTQTPRNMHLAGNTNHAVQFVESDWIIRADDDDISTPDRCTIIGKAIAANPGCSYLYTKMIRFEDIQESEILASSHKHRSFVESTTINVLDGEHDMWTQFSEPGILHQAWSAKHFKIFGDLPLDGYWVDDVIANMRCCAIGSGVYINAVTAYIRWNAGNMSQGGADGSRDYHSIMRLEEFHDNYYNKTFRPLKQTFRKVKEYLKFQETEAPLFIASIQAELEKRERLCSFWRKGTINRIRISKELGHKGIFSALRCLPMPIFAFLLCIYRKLK